MILEARKEIAQILDARADEIIFTSGGTEGNNLAFFGTVSSPKDSHLIVSAIEHPSVLECARELEKRGAEVTYLLPDAEGIISAKSVKEALRENTVLVSVMYANNEIGTIQPIAEIAKVIREWRKAKSQKLKAESFLFFHTDACQATNYLPMNVLKLGVDLLTFNASKIYGPKGIGALYAKRGTKLAPIVFGGGQERGLRSGTEDSALVKGFAEAMRITEKMKEKESARLAKLRDFFIQEIRAKISGTVLNGSSACRLPNNVNISFPGADAEQLVIQLDAFGIAVGTGSACANISGAGKVSHVLTAIGADRFRAAEAVRFTLGRETKKEDLLYAISTILSLVG
jgi:cysteine desulfurase